jgi:hypothetical protein
VRDDAYDDDAYDDLFRGSEGGEVAIAGRGHGGQRAMGNN